MKNNLDSMPWIVFLSKVEIRKSDIKRLLSCSDKRAGKIFNLAKEQETEKGFDPYNLRPTTVLPTTVITILGHRLGDVMKIVKLQKQLLGLKSDPEEITRIKNYA